LILRRAVFQFDISRRHNELDAYKYNSHSGFHFNSTVYNDWRHVVYACLTKKNFINGYYFTWLPWWWYNIYKADIRSTRCQH